MDEPALTESAKRVHQVDAANEGIERLEHTLELVARIARKSLAHVSPPLEGEVDGYDRLAARFTGSSDLYGTLDALARIVAFSRRALSRDTRLTMDAELAERGEVRL